MAHIVYAIVTNADGERITSTLYDTKKQAVTRAKQLLPQLNGHGTNGLTSDDISGEWSDTQPIDHLFVVGLQVPSFPDFGEEINDLLDNFVTDNGPDPDDESLVLKQKDREALNDLVLNYLNSHDYTPGWYDQTDSTLVTKEV